MRAGIDPVELAERMGVEDVEVCVCRNAYRGSVNHGHGDVSLSWRADLSILDKQSRRSCMVWLYQQHINGWPLSLRQVAQIIGVTHKTVSYHLEHAGLARRPKGGPPHPARERLTPHLVGILRTKMTMQEIASYFECSLRVVEDIAHQQYMAD